MYNIKMELKRLQKAKENLQISKFNSISKDKRIRFIFKNNTNNKFYVVMDDEKVYEFNNQNDIIRYINGEITYSEFISNRLNILVNNILTELNNKEINRLYNNEYQMIFSNDNNEIYGVRPYSIDKLNTNDNIRELGVMSSKNHNKYTVINNEIHINETYDTNRSSDDKKFTPNNNKKEFYSQVDNKNIGVNIETIDLTENEESLLVQNKDHYNSAKTDKIFNVYCNKNNSSDVIRIKKTIRDRGIFDLVLENILTIEFRYKTDGDYVNNYIGRRIIKYGTDGIYYTNTSSENTEDKNKLFQCICKIDENNRSYMNDSIDGIIKVGEMSGTFPVKGIYLAFGENAQYMYYSDDDCETWWICRTTDGTAFPCNCNKVEKIGNNRLLAFCHFDTIHIDNIYYSDDNGKTWTRSISQNNNDISNRFKLVRTLTNRLILFSKTICLYSDNNGESWNESNLFDSNYASDNTAFYSIYDIYVINSTTLFAFINIFLKTAPSRGSMRHIQCSYSTNNGETWNKCYFNGETRSYPYSGNFTNTNGQLFDIPFNNSNNILGLLNNTIYFYNNGALSQFRCYYFDLASHTIKLSNMSFCCKSLLNNELASIGCIKKINNALYVSSGTGLYKFENNVEDYEMDYSEVVISSTGNIFNPNYCNSRILGENPKRIHTDALITGLGNDGTKTASICKCFTDIVKIGDILVFSGVRYINNAKTNLLYYSSDGGVTIQPVVLSEGSLDFDIGNGYGKFGIMEFSTEGLNFTTAQPTKFLIAYNVKYVTDGGYYYNNKMFYSKDGINWKPLHFCSLIPILKTMPGVSEDYTIIDGYACKNLDNYIYIPNLSNQKLITFDNKICFDIESLIYSYQFNEEKTKLEKIPFNLMIDDVYDGIWGFSDREGDQSDTSEITAESLAEANIEQTSILISSLINYSILLELNNISTDIYKDTKTIANEILSGTKKATYAGEKTKN